MGLETLSFAEEILLDDQMRLLLKLKKVASFLHS